MNINLTPFLVLWMALSLVVVAMIVYRKLVARQEDDMLHVLHGSLTPQIVVAHKLDVIDKWGKLLTVIAVVYGVLLGAAYIWQAWYQVPQSGV
jgi:hypothetical protein